MDDQAKSRKVELRSEKVRGIIGEIPPVLLRKGIGIISLVIMSLLLMAYVLPYPETLTTEVYMYTNPGSYIIEAPEDGIISFDNPSRIVESGQKIGELEGSNDSVAEFRSLVSGNLVYNSRNCSAVKKKDVLLAVVPHEIQNIYATGYIRGDDIGRVKEGQKVKIGLRKALVKHEGEIIGEITKIYPLPNHDSEFKIEMLISSESLREEIRQAPILEGNARIFISDLSLIKRLITFF